MSRLIPYTPPTKPDDVLARWQQTRGPRLAEMPAIRTALVEKCRRLIAAGAYDAHGCRPLSVAIDRLIDAASQPTPAPLRLAEYDADEAAEWDKANEGEIWDGLS